MNLSRQNRARLAWVKSFFKLRWRFDDYPLDYIDQGECNRSLPERLQHKRWRADLINWYAVSGTGESREAALADAKQKFAAREASGEKMYRPGTGPGIVFASNEAVSSDPELRDDFVHKVLNLEWAWISDESSLWDFHEKETNDEYYNRIFEVYGVDVSDIDGAKLTLILEKIKTQTITT
jgi:hypothetical protein